MEGILLECTSRQVPELGAFVGGPAAAGCAATSAFRTPRTVQEPLADPKRKKVLVVDDVPFNRLVLGKMLSGLGYDVVYGQNGVEAVDCYSRHGEALFCVLMDINMPEMDGLEATQKIRRLEAGPDSLLSCPSSSSSASDDSSSIAVSGIQSSPSRSGSMSSSRRVPIVAVSACSEVEQLCSPALAGVTSAPPDRPWEMVGMDGFMPKPVKRDALRLTLEQLEQLGSGGIPPPTLPGTDACMLSSALARQLEDARAAGSLVPAFLVKECPGSEQVAHCSLGASLRAGSCGSLTGASIATPSAPTDPAGSKRKRVTSRANPQRVVLHPTIRAPSLPGPLPSTAEDTLPPLFPATDTVSEA